jgi:hypothetical protein
MEISSTIVPLHVVIVYCFLQQVAAMNSLQKWLLYLLSVLTSVVSYIPAAIYHYVYTEWFTKYSPIHSEPPTDKSENATNTTKQ